VRPAAKKITIVVDTTRRPAADGSSAPPQWSDLRGHRPCDGRSSSLTHTCPEHVAAQVLSVRRVSDSAERVPIPDQGGLGGATARCAPARRARAVVAEGP